MCYQQNENNTFVMNTSLICQYKKARLQLLKTENNFLTLRKKFIKELNKKISCRVA